MTLWDDLRFSFRMLRQSRAFAAVVVLEMAVSVGVGVTIFTLVDAILLKGLPFERSDRIAFVVSRDARQSDAGSVSYPDFRDWKAQARSFESLAAFTSSPAIVRDASGPPDVLSAVRMSADGFRVLRQTPALGRGLTSDDEAVGAAPVAVLTHGLWERRYGRDASVIGRVVRLNDVPTTIVGVMPAGLVFPPGVDLWSSLAPTPESERRDARTLNVFGRLAEGATLQSARAEMDTIAAALDQQYPATNQGVTAAVRTYNEQYLGPQIMTAGSALMAAVILLLLIASANVANLQLVRAVARSRDAAIRTALGAGRGAIVRQYLVQSLVLATVGGLFGWLIAWWGTRLLAAAFAPYKLPWIELAMDSHSVAALIAISTLSGAACGLVPALRLSAMDVAASLKWQGAGAAVSEIGTKRLTRLLLAVEIALAIVLLVGAGIVGRTFWNLYTAPLGVNTSNVLIMRLPLPPPKYARLEAGVAFHDQLLTRLQSVSGVQAVASGAVPTGGSLTVPYELEGAAPVPAQQRPSLSVVIISPDYFKVWDVPLLRGRFFTGGDRAGSPPVVMVNQAFADTVWPGGDPLAKRLRLYRGAPGSWLTVVGVVAKIVHNDVFPRQLDPVIYLPFDQRPFPGITIMARTLVPPASLSDTFRREVRAIDPDMPILGVTTMAQRLEQNYWLQRIRGSLFAIFACVALLLAAAGLHVVIADTVRQRTYEIGVRMAMGAHARDIWRLVLGETVLYLAVGVAIGVAAAFALMRGLQSVLVGVSPADPGSFAAACAAWMIAMALGCIVPLRRALRLDPVVALRHE